MKQLNLLKNEDLGIKKFQRDYNNKTIKLYNTEVYDQIARFLLNKSRNSEHTANNYESDIRRFFLKARKKNIEYLKREDLMFTIEEFEDYYSYLLDDLKVSKATANRYITSIKECFRHLYRRSLVDDIGFLEIETFSEPTNSYGVLSIEEVETMAQAVLRHGNERTGLIKHLLIRFAVDTCARLNECLTLQWTHFEVKENVVRLNMISKGNKEFRPVITLRFYNELLQLKGNSEYVFNIHRNTVNRMMKQLRDELNIPKERNITFHSFKKAGVDFIFKETRDINQARRAANHSDIRTTMFYIDQEEDYGALGYYSSTGNIDKELYKKVDCDLLIKAIDELDRGQQMYINMKLNEIINNEAD